MKAKKLPRLFGALVLGAVLSVNTGYFTHPAFAASQTQEQPQAQTDADAQASQEPKMPESYEWEIQSNKIPGWPQGPKVAAETAILMDLDSGEILYAKGIDEKRAPASTTKIMTAMLAIEEVPLDTKITFTDEVNNIEAGSTHIGIKPGETLTMEQSLYGILLASANEVSSGVAEYIGGTVQGFVDKMNQRAEELGCTNTHFVNAHGLYSEDHYTTARDLALISREAFQNETFRKITKTEYFIIPPTNITAEERWLNNHHKMVVPGSQYYEGCLGGKPGYTEKAGNTLVTYAQRNDMNLVCVVLKDNSYHYDDTKALLDYGFENFQKVSLSTYGNLETEEGSFGSDLQEQNLLQEAVQETSLLLPKDTQTALLCKPQLEEDILRTEYYYGDTLLCTSSCQAPLAVLEVQSQEELQTNPTTTEVQEEKTGTSFEQSQSLRGFLADVKTNFQELPSWKYPALFLLCFALIFYLIMLVIRIKRSRKRRRRKKAGRRR